MSARKLSCRIWVFQLKKKKKVVFFSFNYYYIEHIKHPLHQHRLRWIEVSRLGHKTKSPFLWQFLLSHYGSY